MKPWLARLLPHSPQALQHLELDYAIVGSFASIAYGEPRFTHDIDILIELPESKVDKLCRAFPGPAWYISQPAVKEAVRVRRLFNVIHTISGNKIDFIVSRDDPWCELQFERRQVVGILEDLTGYAVHPEDVILGKLIPSVQHHRRYRLHPALLADRPLQGTRRTAEQQPVERSPVAEYQAR